MSKTYLLGLDVGSSSVKASIVEAASGRCVASAFYPKQEAPIKALKTGWAEQAPSMWWENAKLAIADTMSAANIIGSDIAAIGKTTTCCAIPSSGAIRVPYLMVNVLLARLAKSNAYLIFLILPATLLQQNWHG